MHKVIPWRKTIRLDRVLTAFLVGIMVFVSTACSGTASAKTADEIRQEVPGSAVTSTYKGGMNDYSDVDPRQNTTKAQTKAKALIDNAQKNINTKSVDSPEQYVENYQSGTPLGERIQQIGENIGDSIDNLKEYVSKGTDENIQRTQENAQNAAENAKQAAKESADTAQSKVKSDIKTTKRTLEDVADKSENIGDKIKQSAQDTAESVKSKVNRNIGRTQQALKDAGEAID